MSAELNNYINSKKSFVNIANKNSFEVCSVCGTDELIGIKDNIIIKLDYNETNDWFITIKIGFLLDDRFYGIYGQSELNEVDFEFMLNDVIKLFKDHLEKEWFNEIQDKKLKKLIKEALSE